MVQVYLAMAGDTDEMLVIRAQQDDSDAFNELMRRTLGSSLKMACGILADFDEAEDQVQNAYLKAWRHLDQFQYQSKCSTWVLRIVTNQCLMRLRQLRGKMFVYLDDQKDDERMRQLEIVDSNPTPEEAFSVRQLTELLKNEISGLPTTLRSVLMLRDLQEASTADTADRLGISQFAVKSRLLRARNEVRPFGEKRGDCAPRDPVHQGRDAL